MKRNKILPNPLGERILAYIDENDTNLTALSLEQVYLLVRYGRLFFIQKDDPPWKPA